MDMLAMVEIMLVPVMLVSKIVAITTMKNYHQKGLLTTNAREFHNVHHSSNVTLMTISTTCRGK